MTRTPKAVVAATDHVYTPCVRSSELVVHLVRRDLTCQTIMVSVCPPRPGDR